MYNITYDQEKGVFDVVGIEMDDDQADNDKQVLMGCCDALNIIIGNVAKQNDNNAHVPQDTPLSLQDAISRGIQAINNIDKSLINRNYLIDIAKLKRDFKIALIQKKYNIDIHKMSYDSNKIFREDEKWWKRIKICGSHLFSTKATLKGKINALFRKFVNSDDLNDDYEQRFNELFNNLMQHNNARKEIKSDKEANAKLNIAFDNGNNNII